MPATRWALPTRCCIDVGIIHTISRLSSRGVGRDSPPSEWYTNGLAATRTLRTPCCWLGNGLHLAVDADSLRSATYIRRLRRYILRTGSQCGIMLSPPSSPCVANRNACVTARQPWICAVRFTCISSLACGRATHLFVLYTDMWLRVLAYTCGPTMAQHCGLCCELRSNEAIRVPTG